MQPETNAAALAILTAPPGELDARQRAALGRALGRCLTGDRRAETLLLDLDAVEYLDEEAVAWMIGLWREAERQGARLAVAGANPIVAHKLARLGLRTLFPIFADVAAARAALLAATPSAAAAG